MIIPKNLEELASYVDSDQKVVFFFTADWCPRDEDRHENNHL